MLLPMRRVLPARVVVAALGTLVGPGLLAQSGYPATIIGAAAPRLAPLTLPEASAVEAGGPAARQEGHPLSGTWAGDWGSAEGPRTHLTIVMAWDGKAVTGLINPGPDAIPLTRVRVDWADWTVAIEAETKDATGRPVAIRAEGRLEEIGSSRRRLAGTWVQGQASGEFAVRRE